MHAFWPGLIVSFLLMGVSHQCTAGVHCDGEVERSSTLRAAVVLTRHGDRSPIKFFAAQASAWPEGPGALTSVGVLQHYELGSHYREKYIDEHGLVRPYFTREDVLVRSTGKERTLMSAHSFMLGFYPPHAHEGQSSLPHGIQPVPIYSATPGDDSLVYAYKNCDSLKDLRKRFKKESKEWRSLEKANEDLFELLSESLGEEIGLGDITAVYNVIKAEKIHGRPTLAIFEDPNLVERIKQLAEQTLRFKFPTQEIGRLGAANLVEHIRDRFEAILDTDQQLPEFELISGHDGTILALFAAIGYVDFEIPDYAAHVAFELHEPDEGPAYMEVLYNNSPILFPGCSAEQCPVHEFSSIVTDTIALEDWHGACSLAGMLPHGEAAVGLDRQGEAVM